MILSEGAVEVGDVIRIIAGREPRFDGCKGTVVYIDGTGGIDGTWGGTPLCPGDCIQVICRSGCR